LSLASKENRIKCDICDSAQRLSKSAWIVMVAGEFPEWAWLYKIVAIRETEKSISSLNFYNFK